MNAEDDVYVGWADLVAEDEAIKLEDLASKVGGQPVVRPIT